MRNPQGKGCTQIIFWKVRTGMAYTFGQDLYLFLGSVFAGIGAAWLRPLGLAVNIIFAVVAAYLVVVVGRWLFGRENL
jgi:hypothetical protein